MPSFVIYCKKENWKLTKQAKAKVGSFKNLKFIYSILKDYYNKLYRYFKLFELWDTC